MTEVGLWIVDRWRDDLGWVHFAMQEQEFSCTSEIWIIWSFFLRCWHGFFFLDQYRDLTSWPKTTSIVELQKRARERERALYARGRLNATIAFASENLSCRILVFLVPS